jgi:CubicO group peptidase (beta-lactamase class C family)
MQNTDSYESDQPHVNMAIGYAAPPQMLAQKSNQPLEKITREANTKMIEVKGTSAGGGYSTANDLHLFALALLGGKLISQMSLDTITTGKINVPPPPVPANSTGNSLQLPQRKYAYGFGESFSNNVRIIGHNGGAPGINAHFYMYPTLGYTAIVLSKYDRAGEPVINFIQNIITQIK